LEGVDRRESVHERQHEKEREQNLHPGLGDAQLLQQLAEVPVRPLERRLRTVLGVPRVVAHQRRFHRSDHRHHNPCSHVGSKYPGPGIGNIPVSQLDL
jgi:hypothetical protein